MRGFLPTQRSVKCEQCGYIDDKNEEMDGSMWKHAQTDCRLETFMESYKETDDEFNKAEVYISKPESRAHITMGHLLTM